MTSAQNARINMERMKTAALALSMAAGLLPAFGADPGPSLEKFHQFVSDGPGGSIVAEFTMIRTRRADPPDPLEERVLYEDDAGRLLVIRWSAPSDESSSTSFECVGSRERITFDVATMKSLSIGIAGASMEVRFEDIDTNLPGPPRTVIDRAAVLFQKVTPECRAALRRYVEIGGGYSFLVGVEASILGPVLFPDIEMRKGNVDRTSRERDIVFPFDPATTPPDDFEQQFGSAYYR